MQQPVAWGQYDGGVVRRLPKILQLCSDDGSLCELTKIGKTHTGIKGKIKKKEANS